MLSGKKILITGGTGSFGKSFIEHVLKQFNPKKLVIYSRDEQKQFLAQKNWTGKKYSCLRFLIGDIRDTKRLTFAMNDDIDIVIHAAAMKHVPIAEYNPFEVVKTNIIGAQNIIEASFENGVEKVIALSTDKASSPINLYGASKLTSDKLFIAANNYVGKRGTKFSVVRYGNVMGSKGSVIPLLLKEKKKGIFSITDKKMTRFNITMNESIKFVLFCLNKMKGGEIFIPKIPSYRLIDLVKAISDKENPKLNLIGIRPGEKLHEEMISMNDALNTLEFKDHFVIVPNSEFNTKINYNKYFKSEKSSKKCLPGFSYSSDNNKDFLSVKNIKDLLKKIT